MSKSRGLSIGREKKRKLTLSMEESVVKKAKQLAADNQTSVSAMFSNFILSAAARHKQDFKIGPLTRKLSGMIKLPPGKKHVLTR